MPYTNEPPSLFLIQWNTFTNTLFPNYLKQDDDGWMEKVQDNFKKFVNGLKLNVNFHFDIQYAINPSSQDIDSLLEKPNRIKIYITTFKQRDDINNPDNEHNMMAEHITDMVNNNFELDLFLYVYGIKYGKEIIWCSLPIAPNNNLPKGEGWRYSISPYKE